jgi:hypothetical protein
MAKKKIVTTEGQAVKKEEQKKSSWGAVLVSFLKEFLLNSFEAPNHLYYDENLTNEGKRKKNYI